MSIRDRPDSPSRRRPPPPPAPTEPPSRSEHAEYWAERFAEERRTRPRQTGGDRAEEQEADGPRGYRVRSEDVWQAAQAEYAAGFSAEAVCTQFDLGLSAFRQRARREGWRRSDAEAEPPGPIGFPPEPEAALPTTDMADLAWRSAAQAIRRGRVYEARAWMRLAAELREMVRLDDLHARHAERLAALNAQKAAAEEGELHGLQGEDGVQSGDAERSSESPTGNPLMDEIRAEAVRQGRSKRFIDALDTATRMATLEAAKDDLEDDAEPP